MQSLLNLKLHLSYEVVYLELVFLYLSLICLACFHMSRIIRQKHTIKHGHDLSMRENELHLGKKKSITALYYEKWYFVNNVHIVKPKINFLIFVPSQSYLLFILF